MHLVPATSRPYRPITFTDSPAGISSTLSDSPPITFTDLPDDSGSLSLSDSQPITFTDSPEDLTGTRADWRALLKFSTQIYLDDFPVPAAARVSLQRSRPRRLSAPNARPNVDDLVPTDAQVPLWRSGPVGRSDAITTIWPHRTLKCKYDDLVQPDAQVPIRRSGPTGRSSAITTIWSQQTLKCNYDDLVPPDAQVPLRRSGPALNMHVLNDISNIEFWES